jgi:hypothetical protein
VENAPPVNVEITDSDFFLPSVEDNESSRLEHNRTEKKTQNQRQQAYRENKGTKD